MQDISREIILKASNGDREAFKVIYSHSSALVYGVALRITNCREDAQEVAQDVFLKIYTHLKDFKEKSSFKTWIYRITVNTSINFIKKNAKLKKNKIFDDNMYFEQSQSMNVEQEEKENEYKIAELLKELNPDQRACMVLRVVEGLKYEEIAKVLKVKINTVRTRIIRARKILLEKRKKKKNKEKGTF